MSELQGLADRVKGATGPSRELDALLWNLIDDRPLELLWERGDERLLGKRDPEDPIACDTPSRYTASLDAALELVSRVMGDRIGPVTLTIAGSGEALICSNDPCGWYVQKFGATPALALLAAMLAAIGKEEE